MKKTKVSPPFILTLGILIMTDRKHMDVKGNGAHISIEHNAVVQHERTKSNHPKILECNSYSASY